MIPHLSYIISTYIPLTRNVNNEYHESFNFGYDALFHTSGFTYNWRNLDTYKTYGYTFNKDYFQLPKNYN